MATHSILQGPSSQVFQHLNISGYANVHVGNAYHCTHDLVNGRSEQDQISILRKALYYDTIDQRRQQIAKDDLEAFSPHSLDWVWTTSLAQWLSSDEPMFWINGKPGSGKSTLINYIASSSDTRQKLRISGKSWTTLQFHFDFRAGAGIANTPEGMLRSFILQLIEKNTEFRSVANQNNTFMVDGLSLGPNDLDTFIVATLGKLSTSVCAFIDGLDEYTGSYLSLMRTLLTLQRRTGMRMCFASRPESILSRQLHHLPHIVMQDHNDVAIRAYLESTVVEILSKTERSMIDNLLTRLVEEANGVVLWARLVADELITSVPTGSSLNELEHILDQTPSEVEQIYTRILNQLPPDARLQSALVLRLILAHQEDNASQIHDLNVTNLLVMSVLVLEDYQSSISSLLSTLTVEQFIMRLNAMLGGLVEVFTLKRNRHSELMVRLVHKTFSTHLRQSKWTENVLGPDFNRSYPSDLWLRLSVLALQKFSKLEKQTGAEILRNFSSKLAIDHWPHRLSPEDLSIGKGIYPDQFARSLRIFLAVCIVEIPELGCKFSPTANAITVEAMSCSLMALHGPLQATTKDRSSWNSKEKVCSCEWLLYWTKDNPLCEFPHLIYSIQHRLFSYFREEYGKVKGLLNVQDRRCLLSAATECSLHHSMRISSKRGKIPPDENNTELIELLLEDQTVEPEHLTIFFSEQISTQVPRYVARFVGQAKPGPIFLRYQIPDKASRPHPDTLFCAWAESRVSSISHLALRLKVVLQLGQKSSDKCGGTSSVFHRLLPSRSGRIAYAAAKLRVLLEANQDLPIDFRDGTIMKDLEEARDDLEQMIAYELDSNDYNMINFGVPISRDQQNDIQDFMNVLAQHL